MSVSIDSEKMQDSIQKLEECLSGIEYALGKLDSCHFPSDESYKSQFDETKASIKQNLTTLTNAIENTKEEIQEIKEGFEEAENRNRSIAQSIAAAVSGAAIIGNTYGNSTNVQTPSADTTTQLDATGTQTDTATDIGGLEQDSVKLEDDTGVETDTPSDVEIDNGEQNVGLEENVPDTQIEAVIELLYGEDITIPDDTRERIVEAIVDINKTEILDGLDEDIANQIRSEIVQDYLDDKLELEGIEAEDLQEYIDSQPSIKIQFEINEAISNFDSLIESGVLTKDQIKSVIENNIEIHDDQEFEKLYIENVGTETDIANIESFYDPETQQIHIRNTVESEVVTVSIVTALDDILFYNEETGEVTYKEVDDLNQDGNVNIGNSEIDASHVKVEDINGDVTIEMPDNSIDPTFTDVENADANTDIHIQGNDKS